MHYAKEMIFSKQPLWAIQYIIDDLVPVLRLPSLLR